MIERKSKRFTLDGIKKSKNLKIYWEILNRLSNTHEIILLTCTCCYYDEMTNVHKQPKWFNKKCNFHNFLCNASHELAVLPRVCLLKPEHWLNFKEISDTFLRNEIEWNATSENFLHCLSFHRSFAYFFWWMLIPLIYFPFQKIRFFLLMMRYQCDEREWNADLYMISSFPDIYILN